MSIDFLPTGGGGGGGASASEIADQTSYDEYIVGAGGGVNPADPFHGFILTQVDGSLDLVDGTGTQRELPPSVLSAQKVYPFTIEEVLTSGSLTLSYVILLRE